MRGLRHTALLSSYYRFSWNIFIGPLMLGNHFLPPRSLFLPFYHWKIEQWPKKRKCGEPFRVLSYKHRPMQTLIRGKSHPGSPLSSALISSVERCSLTLQAELYFGKSVLIKAHSHERRTCLTDQPVTDRIWLTAGTRQTLYFKQNKLDYWIKQQRNEHLNIIYIYLYD